MKGILICGEYINALGIARSASKYRIPALVLDDHPYPICRYSRYCRPLHVNTFDEDSILNSIFSLPEGFVLIPTDDKWVLFLSKYKSALESQYTVISPDKAAVELCCNKKESYAIADNVRIPLPQMYPIDSVTSFPVVVKPSLSYINGAKTPHGILVKDLPGLIKAFGRFSSLIGTGNIIIQEVIPGGAKKNYSLASYFKDGQLMGSFCSRKLKQYPSEFGTGCIVEPVSDEEIHGELRDYVSRFLHAIKYEGVSEVEFMYDDNTHQFKFIEINPRFWMQHYLASLLGVNFMESVLFDRPVGTQQKKDIIWIDELGLIRVLGDEVMRGCINVREYFNILMRKKTFGVLSFRDPVPACAQLKNVVKFLSYSPTLPVSNL